MRHLLVISLLAVACVCRAGDPPVTVAFIVNKANNVETLSSAQLKQIFSGEKGHWPSGEKIQTLAPGADSPEHGPAIHFLFGMTEAEYKKFAIHAAFVGNAQQVPRDSGAPMVVRNLVGVIPGAIGFIRADLVNPSVKLVKIDGLAPGNDGYPLAAR